MKQLQATVVRVNDAKTVKVEVENHWQHPVYKKYVKRTKNYLCGLAAGLTVEVGDQVMIQETRPLSKTKRFVVTAKIAAQTTAQTA